MGKEEEGDWEGEADGGLYKLAREIGVALRGN
jgi:hypothetical protein